VVEKTREMIAAGQVGPAIRYAYRASFDDTVRAYALPVPVACTDRRFLSEFLRPDMGKLVTLLPQLYRWYEPVRYGRTAPSDGAAFLALLGEVYHETVLGTIYRPLFQPTGPMKSVKVDSSAFYATSGRSGP
jgi:hypothetical protein